MLEIDYAQYNLYHGRNKGGVLCIDFSNGMCLKGVTCKYEHKGKIELQLESKKWESICKGKKIKLCDNHMKSRCLKGPLECKYAHSIKELLEQFHGVRRVRMPETVMCIDRLKTKGRLLTEKEAQCVGVELEFKSLFFRLRGRYMEPAMLYICPKCKRVENVHFLPRDFFNKAS